MPPPEIILAQLASIAKHFVGVAILWHVIAGMALIAWRLGWRPQERGVASAMLLPIASFGAIAASARTLLFSMRKQP